MLCLLLRIDFFHGNQDQAGPQGGNTGTQTKKPPVADMVCKQAWTAPILIFPLSSTTARAVKCLAPATAPTMSVLAVPVMRSEEPV